MAHPGENRGPDVVLVVDAVAGRVAREVVGSGDFPDLVAVVGPLVVPGSPVGPAGPPLLGPDGVLVHRVRGSLRRGRVPADEVERRALEEASGERPVPAQRPPWQRPGWAEDRLRWADDVLSAAGRRRTGPPVVLRTWALSHVERIPATGGDVVLKSSCAHFAHEAAVTGWLARRFPGRVPSVLAVRGSDALLEAFVADEPPPGWRSGAAASLARMQVDSLAHLDELRALGAPDRSLARTRDAAAGFASELRELERLDPAARQRFRDVMPKVLDQLDELAGLGVPDTLAHGDLHGGNVAVDPGTGDVVLYDWSDACASFPFADAVHLRGPFQPGAGRLDPDEPWVRRYLAPWREVLADDVLLPALRLTPVAERAFQVVTYEGIARALEPEPRFVLDGVQAQVLAELADCASGL